MKQLFHSPALPSILILLAAAALSGCTQMGEVPFLSGTPTTKTDGQAASSVSNAGINTPVKVTMLLPLSGRDAALGDAMQNAATIAFEDQGYPAFELLFEDTESTLGGAKSAAKNAVQSGSSIVIGPIFADETRAAGIVTAAAGIPMISFSTDTAAIGTNRWIFGIMPQDQAIAVADHAAEQNLAPDGVLIVAPNTSYGKVITSSFISRTRELGIPAHGPIWTEGKTLSHVGETIKSQGHIAYDCAFIPLNAEGIKTVLHGFETAGVSIPSCILGTTLLDDPESEAALSAFQTRTTFYHASSSTKNRESFVTRYERLYGNTPPKLASLSYDTTALALTLGREGTLGANTSARLVSNNGFTGLDGTFYLTTSGTNMRILEVKAFP